jgi:hypothetical protein
MVTGLPERLSLTVLAALCDILTVEPSTLITTSAHTITGRRSATTLTATPTAAPSVPPTPSASEPQQTLRPLRARVTGLDRRNQD